MEFKPLWINHTPPLSILALVLGSICHSPESWTSHYKAAGISNDNILYEEPLCNTWVSLGVCPSVQRILNLLLVKSPQQWQSLAHAPLWKGAFGSIIISINYGRVLCEDWAWPSQAAGAELSPWPFGPWSLIEERSGSRQEGVTGLFIFPKNHCLASAIHVSGSIFLWGKLQDRPRSLMCTLAGYSLVNGHLALFSGYLYAHSLRKKIHFITRNKNIMERTQVAGGWLTGKDIRNKTPDKGPVFLAASAHVKPAAVLGWPLSYYPRESKTVPHFTHKLQVTRIPRCYLQVCLFSQLFKVIVSYSY